MTLAEEQLRSYEELGYCVLKDYVSAEQVTALQQRIDDIMMGKIQYDGMFFQQDPAMMNEADVSQENVFQGPSMNYRKIKDLEYDDLFLSFMQNDLFRQFSEKYIGKNASSMRAMVMNKPPNSTTSLLPYHQDISDTWDMTIPPVFTIWTALDEATIQNGCLEIVPKSHLHGKIGSGHFITEEEEARYAPEGSSLFVELKPGESVIFHNGVLHRSGGNMTQTPRRAFALCLMDAATRHKKTGKAYPTIFGEGALTPVSVRGLQKIPAHVYE